MATIDTDQGWFDYLDAVGELDDDEESLRHFGAECAIAMLAVIATWVVLNALNTIGGA